MQNDKLQICKLQKRREIPFTQSSEKKVIMTFIFYKKNLGEDPFALGMEIHWDKRKGVLELSQRAYLEKGSKEIWYACEQSLCLSYCLSRVTILEFSVFQEPLYDRSKESEKVVPYASAVGSKINAQKNLP